MRLWLIEGDEGTGKTTLAKYLAMALDGAYFHQADYPRNANDLNGNFTAAYAMNKAGIAAETLIWDRCTISGLAYSGITNPSEWQRLFQDWLLLFPHGTETKLVLLHADRELRAQRRAAFYKPITPIEAICERLRTLVDEYHYFDSGEYDPNEMIERILFK